LLGSQMWEAPRIFWPHWGHIDFDGMGIDGPCHGQVGYKVLDAGNALPRGTRRARNGAARRARAKTTVK
jgi:hypothetical protein